MATVSAPCDVLDRVADDAAPRRPIARHEKEPRRDGRAHLTGASFDIAWPTALWIGGIHLAALAAPFCFTWSGLAICLVLYYITGSLGVCLGYHRLLTHGSFSTWRPGKVVYAFLGGISGEGSAIDWVANQRK
ncbi:MAG: hypothetical protein ACKOBP_04725, partial [Planctomycetia bacterium]